MEVINVLICKNSQNVLFKAQYNTTLKKKALVMINVMKTKTIIKSQIFFHLLNI